MPEDVVKTIGTGGDYGTLADFAADLPGSLIAADARWIAVLKRDAADPGGAVIQSICDETRYVLIRAGGGDGAGDLLDPTSDALRVTAGRGALIDAPAGDAVTVSGEDTRLVIERLQVRAATGAAVAIDQGARLVAVEGCLLDANSAAPAIAVAEGSIRRTVVVQRGQGEGIALSGGAVAEGCTVFKPASDLAKGFGIAFGAGSNARSCVAAGFGRAFGYGAAAPEALVSDQENLITVPDDFSDPWWTAVSASVDPGSVVTGPHGVDMQWLGNNLNAFARFDAPALGPVATGEILVMSVVIGQPTSHVSALMLDGGGAGKPELRVDWTTEEPTPTLFGGTSSFAARSASATDLGGGFWRMSLTVENTGAAAVAPIPRFYVTRDVRNSGLNVGMFAGTVMAGKNHIGTGYAPPNAVPGTGAIEGIDPAETFVSVEPGSEDLRPVQGCALAAAGVLGGSADFYDRYRLANDTVGAVGLATASELRPTAVTGASALDAVRLIDRRDVLTATRRRTVLPGTSTRRIGL